VDNFPYSFENIPAAKKMAVGFVFVIKCLGHECSEFFIMNYCSDCEVSQQKIIIVQKCKLLQLTGILSKIFKKVSKIHTSAGYLHYHFVPNKINVYVCSKEFSTDCHFSVFGIIIAGFMEPHDLAVCSMLATK
jgi:hypothetical protein